MSAAKIDAEWRNLNFHAPPDLGNSANVKAIAAACGAKQAGGLVLGVSGARGPFLTTPAVRASGHDLHRLSLPLDSR